MGCGGEATFSQSFKDGELATEGRRVQGEDQVAHRTPGWRETAVCSRGNKETSGVGAEGSGEQVKDEIRGQMR